MIVPLYLALLLFGLSVRPGLAAELPREETARTALKKELSTLTVLLDSSADDLGNILNKTVRKELYKGSTETKGLSADILRNGPITLRAADNFLYITLPVTMTLSYGMFETRALPLTLKFRATARVTPDWKTVVDLQYTGMSELMAEKLGVGPFSFNPRSIVEGVTRPMQGMLSDAVSRKINESFQLKAQVASLWNASQNPVLVAADYNAWLFLAPREVMMSPMITRNNRVVLSVGITSYTELAIGAKPPARTPLPLPSLKQVAAFDRSFRIALNADLSYRDLLAVVAPRLLNKPIESDGKTYVIRSLNIAGSGEKLAVTVQTEGELDGVIQLTCKPHIDPRTNVFSVDDVDFDLQTESFLVKSADWLLHGTFREMIREKLNMDLTQRIEESRKMARTAISQVQLAEHVLLKGTINTLRVNDMLVQKDKLSIQVYAEGESVIDFR